ncbi:uncharacterized protein JCM15063_005088 [Sporobolomyces koalae]|uniref:uncharacterized protein n=1 Tax=Sporobolomyces koalae TaxID=500713 RepID=UPI00317E56A6
MLCSLPLLALLLPLLANAKVAVSKRQDSVVPGSYIIELETPSSGQFSKRQGAVQPLNVDNVRSISYFPSAGWQRTDSNLGGCFHLSGVQQLLSSVLTHLAQPVTATIESLTGSSESSSITLPKFKTRRTYKSLPQVFAGAVVSAEDIATNEAGEEAKWEDVVKGLETIKGVKRAWPVRVVPRPEPVYISDAPSGEYNSTRKYRAHAAFNPTVRNSPDDYKNDVFPPHVMTGVDKLHEQGILGAGVKIGVIDTGVDYKNPILGGCFGENCHVSFGKAFVDDNGNPNESADPYTDCSEHGTHVSGIIGALANNYGFSGVAPHANLGMYRVFGCTGSASDDIIVDALLQSITDKCDIVSLSLGGSAGWLDQSPSQSIVERMNAQGIITTVSAGNDESEGLFYANGPAATRTGLSVGSVDVTQLPAYLANVIGRPALPYLSSLPLDLSSLPSSDLRVYFTSTDSTIKNDGCSPLPDSTPNLASYVTVVQRGSCTFDTKMANVAAKGGKVVLIYNSATASSSVPYLATDNTGLAAVASLRREEGLRLLSYYQSNPRGLRIGFTTTDKPTSVEDTISGGLVSYFSEFGPTFELYGQPSLSAPGGNILSTFPLALGGLGTISGTSMSCPHLAGAVALLISQKASQKLSPLDVRSIYTSTAAQIPTTRGGSVIDSVLLQGGGLLQADKGIATGSIVSPYEIQMNDTAFLNGPQQITIKNTQSFPVTYTFSSSSAVTLGTYDQSFRTDILMSTSPSAISGTMSRVVFSTNMIVVDAGASATVSVTITPARVSRSVSDRFPLYSGFVEIEGSAPAWGNVQESLVVPFFGLSAKMIDMPILDSTATVYGDIKYPFLTDDAGNYLNQATTLSINRALTVYTRLAAGTRRMTIDLVDANTTFTSTIPTDRSVSGTSARMLRVRNESPSTLVGAIPEASDSNLFDDSAIVSFATLQDSVKPASLAASNTGAALYTDTPTVGNILTVGLSPRDALVSNTPNPASDTQTAVAANGYDFIQSGKQYKILVRALKITADPTLASSYESWISYPITFQ